MRNDQMWCLILSGVQKGECCVSPPPFCGLWRGLAGFLTQTVMLRCSGGRKVVLKAQTPGPVLCIGRPQQASQRWERGVVDTL